jgi:epoxide hydrolase 4
MNAVSQPQNFKFNRVDCGHVSLHVATIGQGPPVIFLHGFPEYWRAFAPMMAALSDHFTCIAPDQRGYGLSDRPIETLAYHIDCLSDDIAGLVRALGCAKVDIVAHDWGGLVAWHLASRYPEMLRRMVIFNAPHPFCLQGALDRDPAQRAASGYAARFGEPGSHALMLDQDPSLLWDAFFGADMARHALSEQDKIAQIAMWQQPGAWEAMLNWYRAAGFDYLGKPGAKRVAPLPVSVPTLLVWGEDDTLFTPSTLDGLSAIAPNCDVKVIVGGGHSVFREDLGTCVDLISGFLSRTAKNTP